VKGRGFAANALLITGKEKSFLLVIFLKKKKNLMIGALRII